MRTQEKEGSSVPHVILGDLSVSSVNMALLILRVVLGAVFLAHGINHIYGGGKIEGTGRWFHSLGMRPGILHAWMASLVEIGAGGLLVLGLLTPLAGAGVVGVMLVAFITNHRGNGFFIFRPGEGWEYVMVLTALGVVVGTIGPGQWSIDGHVSALQNLWGWPGFGISLGAGGLGAAGLLAVYWRPDKPAEADKAA
jgi:putative oxidoreductase